MYRPQFSALLLLGMALAFGPSAWGLGSWQQVYDMAQHPDSEIMRLHGVAQGGSSFVTVGWSRSTGDGTALILHSSDGVQWSDVTPPDPALEEGSWLADVEYILGQFVAVGAVQESVYPFGWYLLVYTSSDGIHWSRVEAETEHFRARHGMHLTYGNGVYVLAEAPGKALYSTDLVHWSAADLPEADYPNGLAFGAGKFLLNVSQLGYTNDEQLVSTSGSAWSVAQENPLAPGTLTYGAGDGFVAIADSVIALSQEGTAWTDRTPRTASFLWAHNAAFAGDYLVVTAGAAGSGHYGGSVYLSADDGLTWASINLNNERNGGLVDAAADANGVVVVAYEGGYIYHAPFTTASQLPRVTSADSASATVDSPFSYQITAENMLGETRYYSVCDRGLETACFRLPEGLRLDSTTGDITGTPTTAGTHQFVIGVRDQANAVGKRQVEGLLTLVIRAAGDTEAQIVISASGNTLAVGESMTLVARTENGSDSGYTWHSSDPTVVSVAQGVVTALSPGDATITATGLDTGAVDDHRLTVVQGSSPPPGSTWDAALMSWQRQAERNPDATIALQHGRLTLHGAPWSNGRDASTGLLDGNGIQSVGRYDLLGKTLRLVYRVSGPPGRYVALGVGAAGLPRVSQTTDHSWAGSRVVPDDTWLYTRMTFGADGTYDQAVAQGGFDDQGGTVLGSTSGTLTDAQRATARSAPIVVGFGDNYGGTSATLDLFHAAIEPTNAGPEECLLNWAERTFPALFQPAGSPSAAVGPYYYRHYPRSQSFLGTSAADGQVYYFARGVLAPVGDFSYWAREAGCQ